MGRDYARFKTDRWRDDEDWRDLHWQAQWLYDALVSQPTPPLSRVGVIDWRPGRFADLAGGATPTTVAKAAKILTERRFVLIDRDTEELLVRSYVRYDGVLDRFNMGKAVGRALQTIVSRTLRHAVLTELARAYEENPQRPSWAGLAELFPDDMAQIRGLATTLPLPIASRMG